jgi:agmatine deiminase
MNCYKQLFLSIVLVIFCSCNQERKQEFYLPAEWEPQSGVICGIDDSASFEMAVHLSKEMKVYCFIQDTAEIDFKKKFSNAGARLDSIYFISSSNDFAYAARDGLLFMKNGNGEKQLLNFQWNSYGWYFEPLFKEYLNDDKIKRKAYTEQYIKMFPYPTITSSMVNEGGAIETNGKGTIIQVESVNMHRNPNLNKEQQEKELVRVLNAKKIIWLNEGTADDPFGWGTLITQNYFGIGVRGHVDEFCRFVNENTILLSYPDSLEAEADPVKKITLERMKINYDILKNATDQNGKPFTIIKMPVPDIDYMTFALDTSNKMDEIKFLSKQILYEQNDFSIGDTVHFVPASSYVNFLITNNTVFQAKYWTEGQSESIKKEDEKAMEILEQFFPDRKIIQFNPIQMNYKGGGLHCWTMQVPK